jgi:hypothetical protein
MGVNVTPTKRARIYSGAKRGLKARELGKELGMSERNTKRWMDRLLADPIQPPNIYQKTHKSGRPKKITTELRKEAVRLIDDGEAQDAVDVQRQLCPDVSERRVQQVLSDEGLHRRRRWTAPLLSAKDIARRLLWASVMERCSELYLQCIVFSDEKKFEIVRPDGAQYCRRRPGVKTALQRRNLKKTVKHGGGNIQVSDSQDCSQICMLTVSSGLGLPVVEWAGPSSPSARSHEQGAVP